jgi:aminopeptidase YwaD
VAPSKVLALSLAFALFLTSCGSSAPARVATSTSAPPTAAPTIPAVAPTSPALQPSSIAPDGHRILGYDRRLSVDIGPRPAGTPKEQEAIDFISGLLKSFGYDVTLQEFPAISEASRQASLSVRSSSQRSITALPLTSSIAGKATGALVPSGIGQPSDFPPSVSGNIALIERGELTFQQKVANAAAAGARGVVIYNNVQGTFLGSLSGASSIPAISVSQEDGQALAREAASASVNADISVGAAIATVGHNIIAKPPGKDCETVSGGHYDSVPIAPAASDNGSGTATVIEIADIIARKGEMGSNCFVLFGGEEIGLLGSKAFVASLSPQQKQRLKVMFNFDMVGVGSDYWGILGTPDWQTKAITMAQGMGLDARRYSFNGAASDHESFIAAGIPAVMLYRLTDNLLHTPQDVIDRVQPELLAQAAQFGVNMIELVSPD